MLIEFSCSNHKSIKDKIVFSFLSSSDNSNTNNQLFAESLKLLRSAVIYGPNGSGKSNVLSALLFMKNLVVNSFHHQPNEMVAQYAHKTSEKDDPSEYEVKFITNGKRFVYGYSIVNGHISEEYLYYYSTSRPQRIFERKDMEITLGVELKHLESSSHEVLKSNKLFLSCLINFSSSEIIKDAYLFFSEQLVFYGKENNGIEYSIDLMKRDEELKNKFLGYLQAMDTGIKDVKLTMDRVLLKSSDLPNDMPEVLKSLMTMQAMNRFDVKCIYDTFETDLMSEESNGIQKMFELICPMIDILQHDKILICDEIETGLHEKIVHYVIEQFHQENSRSQAQLFFTTHDTNLLDTTLLRRDQIWFTKLTPQRSTELYSLVELKNIRKTENLERGYISGKYGAIPMLNQTIASLVDLNDN
ncbi:MAG: AAA family ATPase [Erysipelotrichaceae bacterium]